jgi:hypothetical protein
MSWAGTTTAMPAFEDSEVAPFDGAHPLRKAQLKKHCSWLSKLRGSHQPIAYDFLNEIDVVAGMAGFWQEVDDWEIRQDDPVARDEISKEIRQAARALIDEFGSWQPGEAAQ